MTDDDVVFRASRRAIGSLSAVMVLAIVGLLVRWIAKDLEVDLIVGGALIVAAVCGLLLALAVRAVTLVRADGITVQQLFKTRHYPWSEITDIRVVPMSMTGAHTAALFAAGERPVYLPQVTDQLLGPDGLRQAAEAIRLRWQAAGNR